MKTQKSVTARRIIFALTLAGLITIPAICLQAQSSESLSSDEALSIETLSQEDLVEAFAQIKKAQGQRVEGSWVLTVTPVVPPGVPQPPSFRSYATLARGGTLIGSDRNRLAGTAHGTWAHIAGREFAFTGVQDLFNAAGAFVGTQTVRAKLTLIGKDEFVGVANGEIRDAAGNVTVANLCATFRGQRITIGQLAPQCQSIPLPQ